MLGVGKAAPAQFFADMRLRIYSANAPPAKRSIGYSSSKIANNLRGFGLLPLAKKKGMTYGHALLFGARRPECGFPPSAFECLGAAKPLLHNSRPAVGNLRATHRALILLLLAPNHNRLCWVVILFLVQTYSYCTFFAAAVYVGAKSPLRPRLFISAAKKTTPHDPLFLLSQPQPLTLGCGQGRPAGAGPDK